MTVDSEDIILEAAIVGVLAAATEDQTHEDTARQILTALAGQASEQFVITDPRRKWFEAATPTGSLSVKSPGCTHLHHYSNGTIAGSPKAEQEADDIDYLHICELDDFIAQLIQLRELRRRHAAGETVEVCEHECRVRCNGPDGKLMDLYCQACGHQFNEAPPKPVQPPAPAPVVLGSPLKPVVPTRPTPPPPARQRYDPVTKKWQEVRDV